MKNQKRNKDSVIVFYFELYITQSKFKKHYTFFNNFNFIPFVILLSRYYYFSTISAAVFVFYI